VRGPPKVASGGGIMKNVLIACILILASVSVVEADDRRVLGTDPAPHPVTDTVPIVGEKYGNDKIVVERYGIDGSIIQWVDRDGDHLCDYIVYWKAIDDPSWGRFYVKQGSGGRVCPD
jgi:hypothetical protein